MKKLEKLLIKSNTFIYVGEDIRLFHIKKETPRKVIFNTWCSFNCSGCNNNCQYRDSIFRVDSIEDCTKEEIVQFLSKNKKFELYKTLLDKNRQDSYIYVVNSLINDIRKFWIKIKEKLRNIKYTLERLKYKYFITKPGKFLLYLKNK